MSAAARPKLIYLVTEDWYFWSHRLPMARAAQRAGFDVAVACRVRAHGDRIRAAGFALHPLEWHRRELGPLASLRAIAAVARLYRRERPALVHHVALKPAVLGGIAARAAGVPAVVSSLNGVGFVFAADRLRARLMRQPIALTLRWLMLRPESWMVVQNAEDRAMLLALAPAAEPRISVIPGSGIDTAAFAAAPEPPTPQPLTIAFAGRMIETKGVRTVVAAQQLLVRRGRDVRLLLAGAPDADNPAAIAEAELRGWQALPGITWLGHCEDIRSVWRQAHIAVQVSVGEGLPKSLLEAAAMARPIIASDTPGCRDIARPEVNALLIPPGDAEALAAAIERLGADPALRRRFGEAGRRRVESELSDDVIGSLTAALYQRALAAGGARSRLS